MAEQALRSIEVTDTPEQIHPKYDALLVHGYWPSQKGEHTSMGLRTHFATRAAAIRWHRGDVGKIVVDLDHQWGPDYPALAEIMKDALVNKYHVPAEAIIVARGPLSTRGEVDKLIELAKQEQHARCLGKNAYAYCKKIVQRVRIKR
jgi:hypothetical protein